MHISRTSAVNPVIPFEDLLFQLFRNSNPVVFNGNHDHPVHLFTLDLYFCRITRILDSILYQITYGIREMNIIRFNYINAQLIVNLDRDILSH